VDGFPGEASRKASREPSFDDHRKTQQMIEKGLSSHAGTFGNFYRQANHFQSLANES